MSELSLFALLPAKGPFPSLHILPGILKQAQEMRPAALDGSVLSCAAIKP